jgi:hypothetical protein
MAVVPMMTVAGLSIGRHRRDGCSNDEQSDQHEQSAGNLGHGILLGGVAPWEEFDADLLLHVVQNGTMYL